MGERRSDLSKVQCPDLTAFTVVPEQETTATEPGSEGVHDTQRKPHRDGSIGGVPSLFQDLEADLRCQWMITCNGGL